MTDQERFNSKVNVTPTCHLWTGRVDKDGYGLFDLNGKPVAAHIYAYGEVPEGLEVDHLCHRPHCVNRQHLEAVTHTVNLERRRDRQETASVSTVSDPPKSGSADTTIAPRRIVGRPFAPGNNANPRGRPRKGETFADKYIKATERDADAMIAAHVERSKGKSAVAARDFELAAAYHMGRPLQKFVGVVAESGANALDEALAAYMAGKATDPSLLT